MFKLNVFKRLVQAFICVNHLHVDWLVEYFLVDTDSKMLLLVIQVILLVVTGKYLIHMFHVYHIHVGVQYVCSLLFGSYSIVRHRIAISCLFFSLICLLFKKSCSMWMMCLRQVYQVVIKDSFLLSMTLYDFFRKFCLCFRKSDESKLVWQFDHMLNSYNIVEGNVGWFVV